MIRYLYLDQNNSIINPNLSLFAKINVSDYYFFRALKAYIKYRWKPISLAKRNLFPRRFVFAIHYPYATVIYAIKDRLTHAKS